MNKKGFTLVELIAVIAVLGMIIGIATFSVVTLVNRAREKTKEENINNLKDAAIIYCMENHFKRNVKTPCTRTVQELITSGDFVDKEGICSKGELKNKKVTVTIKVINSANGKEDYEATVESGTCGKN